MQTITRMKKMLKRKRRQISILQSPSTMLSITKPRYLGDHLFISRDYWNPQIELLGINCFHHSFGTLVLTIFYWLKEQRESLIGENGVNSVEAKTEWLKPHLTLNNGTKIDIEPVEVDNHYPVRNIRGTVSHTHVNEKTSVDLGMQRSGSVQHHHRLRGSVQVLYQCRSYSGVRH